MNGSTARRQSAPAREATDPLNDPTCHVLGRRTLLTLYDIELHALAFGERLEAIALNGRVMNEAILLSVLGRDKAETLRIVEPLDGASRTHCPTPCSDVLCWGVRSCRTDRHNVIRDDRPHDGPDRNVRTVGETRNRKKKGLLAFGRPQETFGTCPRDRCVFRLRSS